MSADLEHEREVTGMKRRANRDAQQSLIVVFNTADDLISGERLLKRHTDAAILRLEPAMTEHKTAAAHVVRIRDVGELRAWLRSSKQPPMLTTLLLALKAEFDVHEQGMAALASMRVRLPHLLSCGQDQIFVLDREQRMVAFFGHWPRESPRRVEDLLGKRKQDVFGPDVARFHEAGVLRALNGEEAAYEWSITDLPRPVHLLTAASPLRNEDGVVAGVLLVTRNVTALKQAQLEIETALKEKTSQLLEVEVGVRQIAAAFQNSPRGHARHPRPSAGLHTSVLPLEAGARSLELPPTRCSPASHCTHAGHQRRNGTPSRESHVPEDGSPLPGGAGEAVRRRRSTVVTSPHVERSPMHEGQDSARNSRIRLAMTAPS
jgi:PAS domain-containing protein